jgi:hypothetical protein
MAHRDIANVNLPQGRSADGFAPVGATYHPG